VRCVAAHHATPWPTCVVAPTSPWLQDLLSDKAGSLAVRETKLVRLRTDLADANRELQSVHARLVKQLIAYEEAEGREFMHRGRRLLDTIRQEDASGSSEEAPLY